MKLVIKDNYFSTFLDDTGNNEDLNEYIDLFIFTDEMKYFQIESTDGNMRIDIISYIDNRIRNDEMHKYKLWFRTVYEDDGSNTYTMCYVKENV